MIPTRMSTCPIPCLKFSPTPSHILIPCMKIVSKQKYLFYLWATLRYKYVRQSSEVNFLDNSLKQFMGLSDVNCLTIFQHNSSDNFPIKLLDNPRSISCHALTPTIIGCPNAYEMHYSISIQYMLIYQACIY